MADDYVTVVKKLLTSSSGQGLKDYSKVYSNHLDYSTWNNHQRKEVTDLYSESWDASWDILNCSVGPMKSFNNLGYISWTEQTPSTSTLMVDRFHLEICSSGRDRRVA